MAMVILTTATVALSMLSFKDKINHCTNNNCYAALARC